MSHAAKTTGRSVDVLSRVADQLPFDADAIRARVDEVLGEPLYWFPVRHHSPAAARHVEAVILARRPKVVFIEGPAEASSLVPQVVDRRTRPPVAIYCSYRDDANVLGLAGIASPAVEIPPRFSCWYPLVDYSPEYVAMRAATKIGAEVVFIDLPHAARIRVSADRSQPAAPLPAELAIEESEEAADAEQAVPPAASLDTAPEREIDELMAESDLYQHLAAAAGYKSWDEGWDSLFEFGRLLDDPEEFRRELATFCAAGRATCAPARIAFDGTLERERHMWQTIQRRLADGISADQAMVVCGGFHLFLDRTDRTPPPEPPAGTVFTTVVPYSNFRVSELSNYAAGNRAPQFYGMYWEALNGRLDNLMIQYTVGVLKHARTLGETVSSADAISVTQHAHLLAALRGRPVPILDDMHDALVTCCCKGDPNEQGMHLQRAIDEVDIGARIGKVTPDIGRLPIVDDFYRQLEVLQLTEVMGREKRLRINLDKRESFDARRSAFLHRLVFLKIPLCGVAESPATDFATGMIFREKWALRWSPNVETDLIEENLYGDTLETAVISRLREVIAADEPHAGRTCERLVSAIDMDLPDLIREVEQACSQIIDEDNRFVSLSMAFGSLTRIDRYAVYRELRRDVLSALVVRCYNRACFAIPDIKSAPDDQHQAVMNGLLCLAEIVLRGTTEGIDRQLFIEYVAAAAGDSEVPYLRGAFLGLLTEMRELPPEQLANEISALARSPQDQMITAGELLHGILTASRTSILLGAKPLVGAIDELLRTADWDSYLIMLPRMRAAFEQFHKRQRESIAITVGEHYGLGETTELTRLQTSAGAAARIAAIDCRVAEIMQQWEF